MPRTASLKVVQRQIKELQAKAESIKNAEKPGIKELRKLLVKYRLTRADVDQVFRLTKGRSALAGRTVKPKFRNPEDKSQTWTGRGLQPKWLVTAMKETKRPLEHFAI